MRWYKEEPKIILDGEVRVIKRFLFFPKTLKQSGSTLHQTRWLEIAGIRQKYKSQTSSEYACMIGPWYDKEWID